MAKKQEKKYCLCVELLIDGKKKIICLAKYDLLTLQKYTSFCSDAKELLKFMPEDELISTKDFISKRLNDSVSLEDAFSIRGTDSFHSKKIPILYKRDEDVLLYTKQEIIDCISHNFFVSLSDVDQDVIDSKRSQFLINAWDNFCAEEIEREFYKSIEKKLNCDKPETYDSRYEKVLNNKWMLLGVSEIFLNKFINYLWNDTKRRLDFISFIKSYDESLLPQLSYEEKKKRMSSLEKYLNEIGITVHRIRKRIMKNIKLLVPPKEEYKLETKVNACPITSITEKEILMYNKDQLGKDPILDKILFLSEKLEKINSELLVTQNIATRKELEKEIEELEYKIYELENNKFFYTDSGELVKEDEVDKKLK